MDSLSVCPITISSPESSEYYKGRPPLDLRRRPDTLTLVSRTVGTGFEVRERMGRWVPFYMQGVNLGVALPGRFPSEFPTDSATLRRLAGHACRHARERGAGVHHPPAVVLSGAPGVEPRRTRDSALWLVHGVWTELPPEHDFDDPAWKADFRSEMRRVVDLVHGAAELPPRPGHASGRYDADVSRWTLAYIIGREWEPFAVEGVRLAAPRPASATPDRYLAADSGARHGRLDGASSAITSWPTRRTDGTRCGPIAYTNWPTLDPLLHPTESGTAEERAWRRRAGRPVAGDKLEYENDAIGLDAGPGPANRLEIRRGGSRATTPTPITPTSSCTTPATGRRDRAKARRLLRVPERPAPASCRHAVRHLGVWRARRAAATRTSNRRAGTTADTTSVAMAADRRAADAGDP